MRLYEIDYKTADEGVMTFKELVVASTVEGAIGTFKGSRPRHKGLKDHLVSVNFKREIIVEGV